MRNQVVAWLRQPTTVAGLAALAGTVSAMLLRQISWPSAVPLLVGAVTSIALPDNSAARRDAAQLARDIAAPPSSAGGDRPAAH